MVTVEADNRIQVTLADPTKKNLVLSAITGVGDLTIRRVDSVTQPPCPATSTASATVTVLPQFSGSTPVACYTVEPPGLDRSAIASAQAEPEGQGSAWSVLVKLTVAGSPQFDALAASAYGRQLAIVVDDKVLAAPTVNARRFNGALVVVGGGAGFTQSQALVLAATLSTPPLPAKVIGVDCNAAACNSGS